MIDHERRYLFVHIPKTAGTSISEALQEPKDHGHHALEGLIRKDLAADGGGARSRERLMGYFKLAFVRNPWDRLVSLYFEKMQSNWLNPCTSFERFIRNVFTDPASISRDPNLPRHSQPCSRGIVADGAQQVDFVGRFENLQADFEPVCNDVGIGRRPLKWLRRREREHYSTFYSEHAAAVVREHHKDDIERFSYELAARVPDLP